ncbi:RHS repeat-associated core domain-containing protein [Burkholderia contaminans]|uniref:RHS repeat-associated core domain-containing protein n=1 Tax=Burkholderia contaminans TaxID=488447 RepID=UPI002D7FFD25|nr:RHS repeat-associated core domain-containing protein [Burkholderia contaminans]
MSEFETRLTRASAPEESHSTRSESKVDTACDSLLGTVKSTFDPFKETFSSEGGTLHHVSEAVNSLASLQSMPSQLLNTGIAQIPLLDKMPGMPAATIGVPHLGTPHAHSHPPSSGFPLPSVGATIGSGCLSVLIGGIPAARVLDIGVAPTCGGLTPFFDIQTGSSNTFIGGMRAARMGIDMTRHCNPMGHAGKSGGEAASAAEKGEEVASEAAQVSGRAKMLGRAGKAWAVGNAAVGPASGVATAANDASQGEIAAAAMMAAQTAADLAFMALSNLMGKDPGIEPSMGTLLAGDPTVLIGGFPLPDSQMMWHGAKHGIGKKVRARIANREKAAGPCRNGHPVDVVRGTAENEFIDYETKITPAFRWERYYCSGWSEHDGPLGFGFRHCFQHELRLLRTQAIYMDPLGREYPFFRDAADRYGGVFSGYELQQHGERRFVLRHGRLGDMIFERTNEADRTVKLVKHVRDGIENTLEYARSGALMCIIQEDLRGRHRQWVRFHYDDRGHVVELNLTDPKGETKRLVHYDYDTAGHLVAFVDPLGAMMSHAYDAKRRMVRETNANGYSFFYKYDNDGRCVESVGQDGLWRVLLDYQPGRTVVTQADGGKWTYLYDKGRTVTRIVDPYGGAADRLTAADGRIVEEVDAGGRAMRWLYDARGHNTGRKDEWGNEWPAWDGGQALPNPFTHRLPETHLGLQWGESVQQKACNEILLPEFIARIIDELLRQDGSTCAPEEERDACERLMARIDERGKSENFRRDAIGNVIEHRDKDGKVYRYNIQSWNLCVCDEDPLGGTVSYRYTAQEKVSAVVDANGNESWYTYDLKNRIVGVTRHGVVRETYAYDHGDRLLEKRDGRGDCLLRFEVGDNGLHCKRVLSSGETHVFEYDKRGNFTRASTSSADIRLAYDSLGRCIADKRDGKGVEHAYISGILAQTTYLDRFVVRYETHGDGDISIHVPNGAIQRFHRGADGKVLLRLANGTNRLYGYDAEGRCRTRVTWPEGRVQDVHCVEYCYSATNELQYVIDSQYGSTEYRYDDAHRLVEERQNGWPVRGFAYDRGGNLLSTPSYPSIQCKEGNRLTAASHSLFRYDDRNRLAEEVCGNNQRTAYRYNSMDLLVEVRWSDRNDVWAAEYDGLCRRTTRTLGTDHVNYYWDRDRLAAELCPGGALRLYVYADETALVPFMFIDYDSPNAPIESGRAYYVSVNQVGLAERIEDEARRTVWRAQNIDPYGMVTVADGGEIEYKLRFPGHYYDAETDLHYNRFRTYSPALGRYLQPDPAGQSGGVNLYAYASNPLVEVDILGLSACCGAPGNNHYDDCERPDSGRVTDKPPSRRASRQELDEEHKSPMTREIAVSGAARAGETADDLHRQTDATARGMCTASGDPDGGISVQNGQSKRQPSQLDARGDHLSGEEMVALMKKLKLDFGENRADGNGENKVPGRTNASHAEMLAAHDNHFNGRDRNVIGISRPSCGNCRVWLREHAKYTGATHIVSDPEFVRIYRPNGNVEIYHPDGEYVGTAYPNVKPVATRQNYENIPW